MMVSNFSVDENLKSPPTSQLRMVAPPATWIVAEVQVYPVAVEVVGRLNDIVFPGRILCLKNKYSIPASGLSSPKCSTAS